MERRATGTSGLRTTPVALGLAALGRPGYINLGHGDDLPGGRTVEDMEAHAHGVLDAAWAAGVRTFDAARSYGEAERFLGSWLLARGVASGDVTVSSKWGYTYTAGWRVDADVHEVKEHTLAVLERQWPASRERLGEHLRLYQIHSATLASGVLEDAAVLDELHRLREEAGVVIGLSLSGPGQGETLRRALDVARGGRALFGAVQATWNLLERSATTALTEAHERGLVVVIKEALANGRLTARNEDPAFAPAARRLAGLAAELDTSLDAIALAAVLAQPFCDVVLSGATTAEQLTSNLRALAVNWCDAHALEVRSIVEEPHAYWATRAKLPWT